MAVSYTHLDVYKRQLSKRFVELTLKIPLCGPVLVGSKVTLIWQLESAAIELPQAAVLTAYSPVVKKGGTGRGPGAMLVTVSIWVAVAPTSRLP